MTSPVISSDRDSVHSSQFLQVLHFPHKYWHADINTLLLILAQIEKNICSSQHLTAIHTNNLYQKLVFTHVATEKKENLLMNPQLKADTFLSHSTTSFLPTIEKDQDTHCSLKADWKKQWPCTEHLRMAPQALLHSFFFFPIWNEIGHLITCLNQANLIYWYSN